MFGFSLSGHSRRASHNTVFPQLEDDECGWDAAGLLGTLYDTLGRIGYFMD